MRITPAGDVGIGKMESSASDALGAKLYVNGDVKITNGSLIGAIDGITDKGSGEIITDDERSQINTNKSAITDLNNDKHDIINSSNRLSATLIGLNGNISNAEYGYLNGVTGNIQTQLNGKQPTIGANDLAISHVNGLQTALDGNRPSYGATD